MEEEGEGGEQFVVPVARDDYGAATGTAVILSNHLRYRRNALASVTTEETTVRRNSTLLILPFFSLPPPSASPTRSPTRSPLKGPYTSPAFLAYQWCTQIGPADHYTAIVLLYCTVLL